jgi:hypothetical protein
MRALCDRSSGVALYAHGNTHTAAYTERSEAALSSDADSISATTCLKMRLASVGGVGAQATTDLVLLDDVFEINRNPQTSIPDTMLRVSPGESPSQAILYQ